MNDNYEELIENVLNGLDQSEILKIKRMLNDENDDYNVFKEYIKFLILKAQYIYISMPYTLDLIWHKILLLPSIYVKLCKLIFIKLSIEVNDSNMVIEHDPWGGDDIRAQSIRAKAGLDRYKQHFPLNTEALMLYTAAYDASKEYINQSSSSQTQIMASCTFTGTRS